MVRKLRQWIGAPALARAAERPRNARGARADDAGVQLPASLAGLDLATGLWRCNGDARLLRELLLQFGARNANAATELRALLAAGQLEQARFLTHSVKGVAANLGASALAKAASDMHGALDGTDGHDSAACLAAFDAAHATLMASIASLAPASTTAPADEPGPQVPLAAEHWQVIDALQSCLENNDMQAETWLQRLRALCATPAPAWLNRMASAIDALDYPAALAELQQLRNQPA